MEQKLEIELSSKYVRKIKIDYKSILKRNFVSGPVCQVGSLINKDNVTPATVDKWRSSFSWLPDYDFVGIDIFPGPNVDVVADICAKDFLRKHSKLSGRFGLVICRALLEHVKNPFDAAKNITSLLRPGGHLYYAGPWVWGYHPYPDDYWRISFSALKVLFPDVEWTSTWYEAMDSRVGLEIKEQRYERKVFQQAGPVTTDAAVFSDRLMPYLNLGAIGTKNS
jgi:SAM-dependent methyltransferase